MTLDDWLLLIHILAAATSLGGGMMLTLLASRARRTAEGGRMIAQMEWFGGCPCGVQALTREPNGLI